MKDLSLIFWTTLLAIGVWVGFQARQVYIQSTIPPALIELSKPIQGQIGIDFLKKLVQN